MRNLNIHLPKYRLFIQYKLIKRRRSSVDQPIIPTVKLLNVKYRIGSIVHKFLRYIFEHKKIKAILGSNLAIVLVASSFMPSEINGNSQANTALSVVDSTNSPIKTEVGTQFPTNPIKITQGYNFFHPGIDLDGATGDAVKPIKKGRIILVDHSKFAYGNSVIIDHGNNLTSLYAHLSKIEVDEGQEVTTDTKLGEMGATGRAFGDHLHLEVRDHGVPINPLSVLPR